MSALYYGGDIVTMTGPDDRAEALLTADDGTIAFVGDLEAARAHAADMARDTGHAVREADLDGACLMPGLIDAHSHFSGMAQRFTAADLSQAGDFDGIVAALADFAGTHGTASVISGFNYDQNDLAEGRHPDRHVLDRVSADRPIVIQHVSGHIIVCNTAMLRIMGLDADTSDPEGGRYGREPDGRLSGYCEEPPAIMPILEKAGEINGGTGWLDYLDDIQNEYFSQGVTTCQDGATVAGYDDQFVELAEAGRLRLDLVSYPMIGQPIERMLADHADYDGPAYRHHFRFGGVKLFVDGSPQARGAWLSEPYEPLPGSGEPEGFRGAPGVSGDAMYGFLRSQIDAGRQVLAHCNGDAASELFLTQYAAALEASDNPRKRDLRPVMIHCQLARRDQYARMPAIGMIPSLFVSHCWYWGDVHLRNLGEARGGRISAARDALDYGLPLTFHTDAPIIRPNLLEAVWCATCRITKHGRRLDQTQRIGTYDAFRAITANAAYQYGEESSKGTLEAGKLADLTVLDTDPMRVAPEDIRGIHVVQTIKEGISVWKA